MTDRASLLDRTKLYKLNDHEDMNIGWEITAFIRMGMDMGMGMGSGRN